MQACYSSPCCADTLESRDKSTLMRAALTVRSCEERECRFICDETLKELVLATSNSTTALACGSTLGWRVPRSLVAEIRPFNRRNTASNLSSVSSNPGSSSIWSGCQSSA